MPNNKWGWSILKGLTMDKGQVILALGLIVTDLVVFNHRFLRDSIQRSARSWVDESVKGPQLIKGGPKCAPWSWSAQSNEWIKHQPRLCTLQNF